MLLRLYTMEIEECRCITCQVNIITPDIIQEVIPEINNTVSITPELQESEVFKNDITAFIKLFKISLKQRNLLIKNSKETITEFNRLVKPQLILLKNYKKITFNKIKAMNEYKNAVKEFSKHKRFLTNICRKHNLNEYDIRRHLRETARIEIYWRYHNIKWVIMRKLRTRI